MKKGTLKILLAKLLWCFATPFYITAYAISKLFRIKGNEDMPTLKEWFYMFNHMEYNEEYKTVECEF